MTDSYLLRYTARSTTYTLNSFDSVTGLTFHYQGDQNFGMAPIQRITVRGPLQDGDTDVDYRILPRILQLPFIIEVPGATGNERWTHYQIREKLLNVFRPNDRGVLRVRVGDTGGLLMERDISVTVLGGLTFDVDPTEYHVRFVLQLRADNPTWYDPTNGNFVYGSAFINSFRTITTNGNYFAYPYNIRINGPITNPLINNATTGKSIQINATIPLGGFFTLNLGYGIKTVVDNTGANRISTVDPNTDLAQWSLAPGANIIAVGGTSTGHSVSVVSHVHRHLGGKHGSRISNIDSKHIGCHSKCCC
jgi:hypothetical protein